MFGGANRDVCVHGDIIRSRARKTSVHASSAHVPFLKRKKETRTNQKKSSLCSPLRTMSLCSADQALISHPWNPVKCLLGQSSSSFLALRPRRPTCRVRPGLRPARPGPGSAPLGPPAGARGSRPFRSTSTKCEDPEIIGRVPFGRRPLEAPNSRASVCVSELELQPRLLQRSFCVDASSGTSRWKEKSPTVDGGA